MKKAVIISSYVWDDPMTDMACAWYTVYTIMYLATSEVTKIKIGSGWGEKLDLEGVEFVPVTEEIKAQYAAAVKAHVEKRAAEIKAKYEAELEAYNASSRVQRVGQIVEVSEGKYKGIKGKVSWIGKSQFGTTYKRKVGWRESFAAAIANARPYTIPFANENLVLVRPLDGTTFANGKDKLYIDIDKVKVIEGFTPITLTLDDCKKYAENMRDAFSSFNGGYDYHSYV